MGLRSAGDDAAVVSYCRGSRGPEGQIEWAVDRWGVPHAAVGIAEGKLTNPGVVADVLSVSSRLSDIVARACGDRAFNRLLLCGTNWSTMRAVVRRAGALGLPMVADFNEWFLFNRRPAREWLDQELFRRLCVPRLGGLVGISPLWEEYARSVGRRILLVPAMADDEFGNVVPRCGSALSLVYVGVLFRRDLPGTMLAGVRLAIERGVDVRFHILGGAGLFRESVETLQRIDADSVLRERVQVHGWVGREELRRIYGEAGAFVLLRQDDWEARASSPTRLPEYLSSGVPVITSSSENVAGYLEHAENAWLVPAGHAPKDVADAICYVAAHREDGMRIGQAGREVARTKLWFLSHGKRLKEFLDQL